MPLRILAITIRSIPAFIFQHFPRSAVEKSGTSISFLKLGGQSQNPSTIQINLLQVCDCFYKRMDHIVVVNPSFIPKLERYGIPKERITYIPNFVSKDEFYDVDDRTNGLCASSTDTIRIGLPFLAADKSKRERASWISSNWQSKTLMFNLSGRVASHLENYRRLC